MMVRDHPVTETPGGLLVDCGPCTSSLPSLLLYQRKSPLEGVSSVFTAVSDPAGVSGSSLIVGPPDPNVWGCASLYCLLGNLHANCCLCTCMHFQFSGMCNNVYKTSTHVKNRVIRVLAREVKLKRTVGCLQIHHGSPRTVHMVADENLESAYRTRNIRGTVVRSKTHV